MKKRIRVKNPSRRKGVIFKQSPISELTYRILKLNVGLYWTEADEGLLHSLGLTDGIEALPILSMVNDLDIDFMDIHYNCRGNMITIDTDKEVLVYDPIFLIFGLRKIFDSEYANKKRLLLFTKALPQRDVEHVVRLALDYWGSKFDGVPDDYKDYYASLFLYTLIRRHADLDTSETLSVEEREGVLALLNRKGKVMRHDYNKFYKKADEKENEQTG